jgi:alkanesulfonate monooxygenase SsuD/methylene tetrahydromethanopterin reductase-like flavin-dependent oxidoreductase (luciferase family)
MSSLTFGYLLPTQEATGARSARIGALLELGAEAERLGCDTVWLPDSPFHYGLPDPLLVIAALAARTERITLASGVLLAALRQPTLLAQQLASLDALAGGRLRAGFGLGFPSPDSMRQFETAGVPFANRAALLEEAVALMRALWSPRGDRSATGDTSRSTTSRSPRHPPAPAARRSGSQAPAAEPSVEAVDSPTAGCHTFRMRATTPRGGSGSRKPRPPQVE